MAGGRLCACPCIGFPVIAESVYPYVQEGAWFAGREAMGRALVSLETPRMVAIGPFGLPLRGSGGFLSAHPRPLDKEI
jgi:hypothetical protein